MDTELYVATAEFYDDVVPYHTKSGYIVTASILRLRGGAF